MLMFVWIALYLLAGATIAIYLLKDFGGGSAIAASAKFLSCLIGWPVYLVVIAISVANAAFRLLYNNPNKL